MFLHLYVYFAESCLFSHDISKLQDKELYLQMYDERRTVKLSVYITNNNYFKFHNQSYKRDLSLISLNF